MILPSSESAPSQVKPSETGATAEELKQARELLLSLPYTYPPCGLCAEGGEHEEFERESRTLDTTNALTLARALAVAKREGAIEALEKVDKGIVDPFLTAVAVRDALSALREQGDSE